LVLSFFVSNCGVVLHNLHDRLPGASNDLSMTPFLLPAVSQDGDLHLPPARNAKGLNGHGSTAAVHADEAKFEDLASTDEKGPLLATAAATGATKNSSTSSALPEVASSEFPGRGSLALLHPSSAPSVEDEAHFRAKRASVVQFSNNGAAIEAAGGSIYHPQAAIPSHSALHTAHKAAPAAEEVPAEAASARPVTPGFAGQALSAGAMAAAGLPPPPAAAAAAGGLSVTTAVTDSEPAAAVPKAGAAAVSAAEVAAPAAAALTGSAAILAKLRAQRGSSAGSSTGASRPSSGAAAASASAKSPPKVVFLYGSQTGTGQEIAKSLHAEACSKGVPADVMSMNELGIANCNKEKAPIVVIVASSTGDGDPPDNCSVLYMALKKNQQPKDLLEGVHYTVLGLGDSNYTRFMHVSRTLKNR
jgi:flavodoxin